MLEIPVFCVVHLSFEKRPCKNWNQIVSSEKECIIYPDLSFFEWVMQLRNF